jgi:hypothetical protein
VVAAALAHVFTWVSMGWSWLFKRIPTWIRPTLGGIILGLAALVTPYALTNGEIQIVHMTGARIAVGTLALAALFKFVMAAMIGPAGWRGGFIIPLFFVGFCLGELTHAWTSSANEWVMVTAFMVALNVGVTKTPIGSTLVVTEMAGIAVLPTTLLAAVVGLMLTSDSGLIHTQRRREPADAQPNDAEIYGGNGHGEHDGSAGHDSSAAHDRAGDHAPAAADRRDGNHRDGDLLAPPLAERPTNGPRAPDLAMAHLARTDAGRDPVTSEPAGGGRNGQAGRAGVDGAGSERNGSERNGADGAGFESAGFEAAGFDGTGRDPAGLGGVGLDGAAADPAGADGPARRDRVGTEEEPWTTT